MDLWVFVSESCFHLRAGRRRLRLVQQSLIILCLQPSFSRKRTSEVKPCGLRKSSSSILHTWSWITLLWKEAYYQQGCTWDVSKNWAAKFHAAHLTGNEFHRLQGRSPSLGNTQTLQWAFSGMLQVWAAPPELLTLVVMKEVTFTTVWPDSPPAGNSPAVHTKLKPWLYKQRCDMHENRIKQDERE